MDRVRGAIFSSLGDAVVGARTLDIFAGSGAMGIEALSRGAASAMFVDSNARCVSCIKTNLRRTGLEAGVQTMEAMRFLALYVSPGSLDLIFRGTCLYKKGRDDRDWARELAESPAILAALDVGGFFVLECYFSCKPPNSRRARHAPDQALRR